MGVRKLNIFSYNKLQVQNVDARSRNKNILRQLSVSSILKVSSVGLNFLVTPLMIKLLGEEKFGIWVTLLSIASWIAMMDIGIGNGLRNKLTESFAKNDQEKSRRLISTAYISLSLIVLILFLLVVNIIYILKWHKIFNSNIISESDFRKIILIVFTAIAINFVLSLITQIINALQRNSLTSLTNIISNLLLLGSLLFFNGYLKGSIERVAIIYSVTTLLSTIIISALLFSEYDDLKPKFKFFDRLLVNDILNIGFKFFIIQIAGLIIFTTDNLIITQVLGPAQVSGYNITLKVYTSLIMVFGLLMSPLWSAYTEAYFKKDFDWIKSKIKLQNILMFLLLFIVVVVTYFFQIILNLWITIPVNIPKLLPVFAGCYSILAIWNNIYGFVLGGINKIRLGSILTIFTAAINIPLSIYFAKKDTLGSAGVLIGTIISLSVTAIISPIQVYYFIFSTKKNPLLDKLLS